MKLYTYESNWASVPSVAILAETPERAMELGKEYLRFEGGLTCPRTLKRDSAELFWLTLDRRGPRAIETPPELAARIVTLGGAQWAITVRLDLDGDGNQQAWGIGARLTIWEMLPEGVVRGYVARGYAFDKRS